MSTTISAATVIDRLCREMNYSRSHVAKILRENRRAIGARRRGRRWLLPDTAEERLRGLLVSSGPRYKLGETGPNRDC